MTLEMAASIQEPRRRYPMRRHKILTLGTAKTKTICSLREETQRTSKAETEDYMNNGLATLSLFMLGATVFVSSAQAQRHGGFASAPAGRNGMALSRGGSMRTGVEPACAAATGFLVIRDLRRTSTLITAMITVTTPSREKSRRLQTRSSSRPLSHPPRRPCRFRLSRWCLNCKAIIGCELRTMGSRRLVDNPAR